MSSGVHHSHHYPGLLPAAQSLINLIVIALFIVTFVAQPFSIPSASMDPTLMVGDFLLVNKQVFAPGSPMNPLSTRLVRRGDIIVFHFAIDPNIDLVKRVIGLPGERLRLQDGHVFINGVALTEPYAMYRPSMPDDFRDNFPSLRYANPNIKSAWWTQLRRLMQNGEITVPPDHYFVLGDNRNDSEDSRYWGFVPRNAIVGQPMLVYFSLRASEDDPATPVHRNAFAAFLSHLARWHRVGTVLH